jgi:putative membrane-bound dehydrogenase-like protein
MNCVYERVTRRPSLVACFGLLALTVTNSLVAQTPPLRVGASAVNLQSNDQMDIGGNLESRFTTEQEGELRVVAVVVALEGQGKLAIVACDILFLPRDLVDAATVEIEKTTGIAPSRVLANATHTHHAPSVVPAHAFGASEEFRQAVVKGIVQSVQQANSRLGEGDCQFFFRLGEEKTIGSNSRLQLDDGNISWLNPLRESGGTMRPTGPFDPQLPVLDFRDKHGRSRALIFNHSTHTIGTRSGRNVRSPGFYGLAAQELESDFGGVVSFLEGASGSTHNVAGVPVDEAVKRLKQAVREARDQAELRPVTRLAALRRPFKFKVRKFDDAEEDRNILRYTSRHAPQASDRIRQIFADSRDKMRSHQGEERETYVQTLLIGDVALVGVPAEYFTVFGVDIKQRSPFKNTYIAELANDWIGYLPDREGHRLGGYQTWLGLHSYAEIGTGERMADEVVQMLNELAGRTAAGADGSANSPKSSEVSKAGEASLPLSPDKELASFQLSDANLKVELVAAEPEIVSPVAMAWDANGRLFVAEMIGYPQSEGMCRIAILEDRDGDGKYQRTSTFADGMNFVNSVMPFRQGILATSAPDILYLEDSDGDGRADIRRVEWTGFHTGSQQLRANALHWGLDNFIYGANGRVGGAVRRPDAPVEAAVSLRTRDFRFDPMGGRFESLIGQSQFGQSHDDWGNRFLSLNTIPVRHAVLDDADLRSYLHGPAAAVVNIANPTDTGRIYPVSPPPRQFNSEQPNYYNAMCGLSIYRGDVLGAQYAGNAFICESLANLITRRVLTPDGPTFLSERAASEVDCEFLASKDGWFHPAFTTTGPDGTFYVVDFYREFVEHPMYVADKKARAETDWRNGASFGRLWRVVRKDQIAAADNSNTTTQISRSPNLQHASVGELVKQLSHPVGWWRDTAQRLLVERQDKSAVPVLRQQMREATSPLARSHAMWTLRGLHELKDDDLIVASEDPSSQVRQQAVRAAGGRIHDSAVLQSRLQKMIDDSNVQVRFQVAIALGDCDLSESSSSLATIIERDHDNWMRMAVLCAVSNRPWPLLEKLLTRDQWMATPSDWQVTFVEDLGEQLATCHDDQLKPCFDWLLARRETTTAPGVLALLSGLARGIESHGSTLQRAASNPEAVWARLQPKLLEMGTAAYSAATNDRQSIEVRRSSVELLGHLPFAPNTDVLLKLLSPLQPQPIQTAAAKAVSNRDDAALYRRLFTEWQSFTAATRREILNALLKALTAGATLLDAVSEEKVLIAEVPAHVREAFLQHRDAATKERAKQVFAVLSSSGRQEVVAKYLSTVPPLGDVGRGAALFRQHCFACHAVQGVGQRVGPDLAAVGSRRRDYLVIDILDPSRHVAPDFSAYVAVTRQGRVFSGILAAETADTVTFRRERGEQDTVLRSELEELRPTGKSIMPEGFEKHFSPEQLADLLEFLRQPDGKRLAN